MIAFGPVLQAANGAAWIGEGCPIRRVWGLWLGRRLSLMRPSRTVRLAVSAAPAREIRMAGSKHPDAHASKQVGGITRV